MIYYYYEILLLLVPVQWVLGFIFSMFNLCELFLMKSVEKLGNCKLWVQNEARLPNNQMAGMPAWYYYILL